MNEQIKKLTEKFKNGKTVMIIGIVGIILIFLSSILPASADETASCEQNFIDENKYLENLQEDITALVKKIAGCNAKVVITLDSGVTYNYAAEIKNSLSDKNGETGEETEQSREEKKMLAADSSGAENPIMVNSFLPQIRGVAVVYYRTDDERLNEKISAALKAALSVASNQIFIYGNGG